jgi:hypothetical protein
MDVFVRKSWGLHGFFDASTGRLTMASPGLMRALNVPDDVEQQQVIHRRLAVHWLFAEVKVWFLYMHMESTCNFQRKKFILEAFMH